MRCLLLAPLVLPRRECVHSVECALRGLYHKEAMGVKAQVLLFVNKHRLGRWLVVNGISACDPTTKQNEMAQSET